MRDQVAMSKGNGELVIAIPLYRSHHTENIGNLDGYSIQLFKNEPLAYAIEHPEIGIKLFNADFVHANIEFLGDLEDEPTTINEKGDL